METNNDIDFEADYKGLENEKKNKRRIIIGIIVSIVIIALIFLIILLKKKKEINMAKDYDFFVYSFQCVKCYCYTLDNQTLVPECKNKTKDFEIGKLTIHGMWPSIKNKKVNEIANISCNTGKTIPVQLNKTSDIFNEMNKYWPSAFTDNDKFWTHEYNKHGYCYNVKNNIKTQNYENYFKEAIKVFKDKKFYDLITGFDKTNTTNYKINITQLQNYFNNSYKAPLYLSCKTINKIQYITEFQVALDLNYNFISNENMRATGKYQCNGTDFGYLKYDDKNITI